MFGFEVHIVEGSFYVKKSRLCVVLLLHVYFNKTGHIMLTGETNYRTCWFVCQFNCNFIDTLKTLDIFNSMHMPNTTQNYRDLHLLAS